MNNKNKRTHVPKKKKKKKKKEATKTNHLIIILLQQTSKQVNHILIMRNAKNKQMLSTLSKQHFLYDKRNNRDKEKNKQHIIELLATS